MRQKLRLVKSPFRSRSKQCEYVETIKMPTGTNDWNVETYKNKLEKSRIRNSELGKPCCLYDLLTEIRWYFDTGNVEIPLFLFLRMNTTLSNIWNKPLQNIKFQFDNGTKSVFLSIMWTETEAKEPAIISKKFHSGEQDWTIGLIWEINFLQKKKIKGN